MAATVTIDKAYFETLLRRYVQTAAFFELSLYRQLKTIALTSGRAEFVGLICKADWLLQ